MTSNTFVSCLCPTFGRFPADGWMLEECVYWFTRRTHKMAELIICNDDPDQLLVCDVPGVRVHNRLTRFATLGQKYNHMVFDAAGSVLMPWEDDDINLPDRIEGGLKGLEGYEYFNPKMAYFQVGRQGPLQLCSEHSVHHNTSAYTRRAFHRVGGYADALCGPQDADMDYRLRAGARVAPADGVPRYVYRWQHASGYKNLSGNGDPAAAYAGLTATPGTFVIEPKMHRDYGREILTTFPQASSGL